MKNSERRTTKPLGNRKVTSKVTKKPATSGAPRSSLGVYLSGSSTRKKELIQKRRAWRRQGKNATGNNLKKEQGVNRCRQALVARLEEYNRLFADIYARSGMLSVILRSLGYSEDDIIHLKHQIEEYLDELDDIRRRTPLTNTTSIEEAVSTAATTILQQHKKEH